MKTKIGISQFFKSNTPKAWQIIGDLALTAAAIGTGIIGLPAMMEASGIHDFIVPAFLMLVAKYCLAFGSIVKFITKFIGQKDHPETN